MEVDAEERVMAQMRQMFEAQQKWLDTKFDATADTIRHGDAQGAHVMAGIRSMCEQNATAISDLRRNAQDTSNRIGEVSTLAHKVQQEVSEVRHKAQASDIVIEAERKERHDNSEWRKDVQRDWNRMFAVIKWFGPPYVIGTVAVAAKILGGT